VSSARVQGAIKTETLVPSARVHGVMKTESLMDHRKPHVAAQIWNWLNRCLLDSCFPTLSHRSLSLMILNLFYIIV
jgi:hypothetical protein